MTPLVDELAAILTAEAGAVRRLLPILRAEEQALLRADVAAVGKLTAEKETLARDLAALEQGRRGIVGRLATALAVRPEAVTLSYLLARGAGPMARLGALREELRGLLGTVVAQNGRNGFLIEKSLGWLRGLLGDLVAVLTPAATYAPTGRTAQSPAAAQFLDRRA